MSKKPKVLNVLLCDDIRQEANGKYIVIGIYSGDVLVPEFPTQLVFATYIEFVPERAGEQQFHFRLVGPDGPMAGVQGKFGVAEAGPHVALPIPGLPVSIKQPCDMLVQVSFDGQNWTTALKKPVRIGEAAPVLA